MAWRGADAHPQVGGAAAAGVEQGKQEIHYNGFAKYGGVSTVKAALGYITAMNPSGLFSTDRQHHR